VRRVTIEQLDGEQMPVIGEMDEGTWEAVSGGQPVALTRRGRTAAVLVDADSYAEMVRATQGLEGAS
jgi:hypothetical protein